MLHSAPGGPHLEHLSPVVTGGFGALALAVYARLRAGS